MSRGFIVYRVRAFSLLEVLFVVGLLATVTSVLLGLVQSTSQRQRRLQAEGELSVLGAALDAYRRYFGDYPRTTDSERLLRSLRGEFDPAGAGVNARNFLAGTRLDQSVEPGLSRLLDPWGTPYRYAFPKDEFDFSPYLLWSCGPDEEDARLASGAPDADHPANRDNVVGP